MRRFAIIALPLWACASMQPMEQARAIASVDHDCLKEKIKLVCDASGVEEIHVLGSYRRVSAKRAYVFEVCGTARRYESVGYGDFEDETWRWGTSCQPVNRQFFICP